MIYLLDTHVLIWSRLDPAKLSQTSLAVIADRQVQKRISTITAWEISLKYQLGKLELGGRTPEQFLGSALALGYEVAVPAAQDMISFHKLPPVAGHKDPFDRMLIWQAICHDMKLLSHDGKFDDYCEYGLQVAG